MPYKSDIIVEFSSFQFYYEDLRNYGWDANPFCATFSILRCSAHVLKRKSKKLESRLEVCMFVGYYKEKRRGIIVKGIRYLFQGMPYFLKMIV